MIGNSRLGQVPVAAILRVEGLLPASEAYPVPFSFWLETSFGLLCAELGPSALTCPLGSLVHNKRQFR